MPRDYRVTLQKCHSDKTREQRQPQESDAINIAKYPEVLKRPQHWATVWLPCANLPSLSAVPRHRTGRIQFPCVKDARPAPRMRGFFGRKSVRPGGCDVRHTYPQQPPS